MSSLSEYQHITVEPATTSIGAYLSGFDLNDVQHQGVYDEIRRAVDEFHVIFMRKQKMSSEAFVTMGRNFGKLETSHTVFDSPDTLPEIQTITFDPNRPIETNQWHTDNTYMKYPSAFTILQALDLPPCGGDTLWVSNRHLYDVMPEPMQKMLEAMDVEHDLFTRVMESNYLRDAGKMDQIDNYLHKQATHPAVITHPRTGKKQLLVNRHFAKCFVGVHEEINRDLLSMIFNLAKLPDFQVRLTWEVDTVAIWDNWSTMHYAVMDYAPYPRSMQRMVVESDVVPAA